jgi:fermentation-respiration switch protein FrsA (DUF1100 family)
MTTPRQPIPQTPIPQTRSLIWRVLRRIGLFCLIPYLCVVAIVFYTQRSLIYHPKQDSSLNQRPRMISGYPTQPVKFQTDDGLDIHGWIITVERSLAGSPRKAKPGRKTSRPVVLYFCGNANHRGARADVFAMLLEAGADVACFDYRGYGDNAGSPSEEGLASDARGAWKFLIDDQGYQPGQIVIFGESLGGGIATRLAAEMSAAGTPPAGLVLRSTFSRLADAAAFHYPWLPARLLLLDRFPSIDRIRQVTCPILILHGQRDTIVPYELGKNLFTAAPAKSENGVAKKFVSLPDADHNDVLETSGEIVRQTIREFLQSI